MSFEERIDKINSMVQGWQVYFRGASIQQKLLKLDGWLRNRLRYCIWHHWKKPEKKRRSLIRLGVPRGQAYAWSRMRKGGWATAQSPILGITITIKRLKNRGYVPLADYFTSISPDYNNSLFPVI